MPLLDEAVRQQLSQHPFALQQPGVPTATPTPSAPWRPSPMASTLMILGALLPMMAGKFGGKGIPPEWEAENLAQRPGAGKEHQWATDIYKPGTRVSMRPWGQRTGEPTSIYAPGKLKPNEYGEMAGGTGVVVTPGTPEAGEPAYTPSTEATRRQPTADHVAVRGDQSGYWFWRHRDSLEVLPPHDFKAGDKVVVSEEWGDLADRGEVATPPAHAIPSPGPGWVWVDIAPNPIDEELDLEPAIPPEGKEFRGIVRYKGGAWGAWILRTELAKKK